MTREEKTAFIEELSEKLANSNIFYLTDTSELNAEATAKLRRECFKKNVQLTVVKNKLLEKAFDKVEGRNYDELKSVLAGPTAIMYSEVGNVPAKLIEEFRKKNKKPLLKAAYVEEAIYIGDDQLKALTEIKSKEELLGELVGLLQSPAKNVISALKSGGNTIAGLVKTLSEK
jgi:large subunit ribosomal protein L10